MPASLWVANVTAFTPDGAVDTARIADHVRWMEAEGVQGFCPAGTTGGFLYLTHAERRSLHAAVIAAADQAATCPCVWDPVPARMAELARAAEAEGATAVFAPPPVYHKVGEEAVLRWYAGLRAAVDLPVYAYHHPDTHNPLSEALIARLLDTEGLDAVKDSSVDDDRVRRLAARWPGRVWVGGDGYLGRAPDLGPIAGHISGLANGWPAEARGYVDRPDSDRTWLATTRAGIKKAGGTAASIRERLGLGHRAPLDRIDPEAARSLPRPTFPGAP